MPQELNAGKLPPALLESLVLAQTGASRPEVIVPATFGEDCAVLDVGGDLLVISTDPITAASADAGSLVVHVSCNDVAATGAEPFAMLLTVMVPVGTTADWINKVMAQVNETAASLGVQVVGGHTEVTPGLSSPILSGTVVGRVHRDRLVKSGGARPGDALLMTRTAGVEGTAILAADYPEFALSVLGPEAYARALAMSQSISVVSHARAARDAGATAMHDVTEGGILGAAFEMAAAANIGIRIDASQIPVSAETAALCGKIGIDPTKLISSGCLLIATPEPSRVIKALEPDVRCTQIGVFSDGRHEIITERGTVPLEPPEGDELWTAKRLLDKGQQ